MRGFSWKSIPITWRNRRSGVPKLKSRRWAAANFLSASISGWRNTSAAAIIGDNVAGQQ